MRRRGTPVSREALSEVVWTDAATVVVPRYGLPDVGLVKIFKKLGIPVAGRGCRAQGRPLRPRGSANYCIAASRSTPLAERLSNPVGVKTSRRVGWTVTIGERERTRALPVATASIALNVSIGPMPTRLQLRARVGWRATLGQARGDLDVPYHSATQSDLSRNRVTNMPQKHEACMYVRIAVELNGFTKLSDAHASLNFNDRLDAQITLKVSSHVVDLQQDYAFARDARRPWNCNRRGVFGAAHRWRRRLSDAI